MTDEYRIATTKYVRKSYTRRFSTLGSRDAAAKEFDRWLDRVLSQAWNEGYWQGINGHTGPGNPYEEVAEWTR